MKRTIMLIPDPNAGSGWEYRIVMNPSVPEIEGKYVSDNIETLFWVIQDKLRAHLGLPDPEPDDDGAWLHRNVRSIMITIDW